MKKDKDLMTKTIIPEIEMAQNICFAAMKEMSEDRVIAVEDVDHVLIMAKSLIGLCINKAKRLNDEEPSEHVQREAEPTGKVKAEGKVSKEVEKSVEAVQHMFNAYAMIEVYLAKQENREVNDTHLAKMARRITRACFKGVKGIEAAKITAEIYKDKDSFTVEIIMPKSHEE